MLKKIFSRTTSPISTKLSKKHVHAWVVEIQIVQIKGQNKNNFHKS